MDTVISSLISFYLPCNKCLLSPFLQLTTLNVLHKLRGSIMPGYVSLFEKHKNPVPGRGCKSRTDSLDLDHILDDEGRDPNDAEDCGSSMNESDLESMLNARVSGRT